MEELDPALPFHISDVFRTMVQGFVSSGLERNVTLRGAPYDFRYAPSSPQGAQYIQDLQGLIEQTSYASGSRVSIVSHSMGCLQTLYLLNQQSQAWKDKFIEKWIPLAGPYGGSVGALLLQASGDKQGFPVDPLKARVAMRSYETNFWLSPVPERFGDQVLVTTPSRNYTAQDYDAFYDDIGHSAGKKLMKRVQALTSSAKAPGVDVVCMYSSGVDTPLHFHYGKDGFDKPPVVTNGDGDGTVNTLSLRICDEWTKPGAQTRSAKVQRFSKVTHKEMLTDPGVLKAVSSTELGMATAKTLDMLV